MRQCVHPMVSGAWVRTLTPRVVTGPWYTDHRHMYARLRRMTGHMQAECARIIV
jgi:hypothetical protein